MKKFFDFLFSTRVTLLLLLIFALGSAIATFIEDKYDTLTAQMMVYDARWFEILMLLLVMNFIGNIRTYKFISRKKITGFVFHLAFVIIILGAGVTRYFGFEGNMPIREGKSSSVFYSGNTYFQAIANCNNKTYAEDIAIPLSEALNNSFQISLDVEGKGEVEITYHDYIENAVETVNENVTGGIDMLYVEAVIDNAIVPMYIEKGDSKKVGKYKLAFDTNKDADAISIIEKEGVLSIVSKYDIVRTNMMESDPFAILKDSVEEFKDKHIYRTDGILFAFNKLLKKAKLEVVEGTEEEQGISALLVDVSYNNIKKEAAVFQSAGYAPAFKEVDVDGIALKMAYGYKEMSLPFSLYLDDFVLERYPGSMSPSSYSSEVSLIDAENSVNEKHDISMNNVLDYDGYRFFQSSYDVDEKGTILSVNHDFWGTWITYLGYFLLVVGFLLTLINKNSRFYMLRQNIRKIRDKRKAGLLTVILLLGMNGVVFSQAVTNKIVSREHAEKFGHLIVQTYDGRFEPVHTLAYDVMHKISRKDKFDIAEKGGTVNAMQVFIDMLMDPEFWKKQEIIYIREKSVRDILGVTEKYAAYNDFISQEKGYKLTEYSEEAFRKKPSEQNTFDKDIIKVNERLYIFQNLCEGSLLKIFPAQNSENNKWVNYFDTLAHVPLTGSSYVINDDLQLKIFTYGNVFELYFQSMYEATQSGDYERADQILGYIESMQRQNTDADLLPSETKVNYEIFYNKAKIFENLRDIYGILSIFLLLLAFIENLRLKKNIIIKFTLNVFIVLLGFAFLFHTYGMGLRWYLTGHAPWSNGYEALLLVAWGGVLAGFSFLRYSKITLAATALLAFAMLMTAGHSSYDPQLTNLQPVLKSYWLIIHVAAITISYGFLGLGFIIGLMNMLIYLFKNARNSVRLDLLIQELTFINEMNLEVGLFLATIGTFLGGIWANVSWGRYWGWDAKETWALIIIIVYALILHFRLVPKLRTTFAFNAGSIVGFGTVLMTFIGVNYYLSKGLHSYGSGDTPIFPVWAWIMILCIILLIVAAGVKDYLSRKKV
ncbi:MAG: cytochrome c biogenesis protein CcsA [Bacteroidota bacterium]